MENRREQATGQGVDVLLDVSNRRPIVRGFIGASRLMGTAMLLVFASSVLVAQAPPPATGRVTGVVYDSIAGAPLAGVTVQFVATDPGPGRRFFSATSNGVGRYEISEIPAGRYLAGFFHQALDTLGIEMGPRQVSIEDGSQTVPLATPSPRTLKASICPNTPASEGTGLLIGHVRKSTDESAVSGAFVVAEWNETIIDDAGIHHRDARVHGATTGPGWFAICHVPTDAVLHTRASFGPDSSGWVALQIPPDGIRHVTYFIGAVTRVGDGDEAGTDSVAAADSLELRMLRGRARLTGTVRNEKGEPLVNAVVVVWETGLESLTRDDGSFTLDSLPDGTHMLEARALGYMPVHLPIHLAERRPATAELNFRQRVVVLPAVQTRAQLVYSSHLAGFERRRRRGFGEFLTPAQIEAKSEQRLGRLLQEVIGLELIEERGGLTIPRMRASRGGGTRYCTPSLYVDGLLDRSTDLDLLYSNRIMAVEIYNREFSRPPEFSDKNPCGAIVVWMKPISPQPRVNR